jgi:hypothetical protein
MSGGLMGLIRSGCYDCVKSLDINNFYYPCDDIDEVIRFYILALKQGYYSNDFGDEHYAFVFNQFDMFFLTNYKGGASSPLSMQVVAGSPLSMQEANINLRDYQNQNTYLHEVCESTMWGSSLCEKIFTYFLERGVDPFIKNGDGLMCFELIENEKDKKKIIKLVECMVAEHRSV